MFHCDNQRSEKTLGFWQLASVVINEGEESYTTNLCKKCFNESLKAEEKPLTNWQWRDFRGTKGAPWKALEDDGKRTIRSRYVGIFFSLKETE